MGIFNTNEWTLKTDGGIPYVLYEGYPIGSISKDGEHQAVEKYLMRAVDLPDFLREAIPPDFTKPPRALPGNLSFFYTDSVTWEPLEISLPSNSVGSLGGHGDAPATGFVLVTINYSYGLTGSLPKGFDPNNPDAFDPILWYEVAADATFEYLKYNVSGKWQWMHSLGGVTTPVKEIDLPAVTLVPQTMWTVRWPKLPARDVLTVCNRCRAVAGCVNTVIMPVLQNALPYSVLCLGYSFQEATTYSLNEQGEPVYEQSGSIEIKLLEKRINAIEGSTQVYYSHWNMFNEEAGRWDFLLKPVGSDGNPASNDRLLYPYADLNQLFAAGS
jgi:hypothetical protein